MLLKVYTLVVNYSQYLDLIFVLIVFFFVKYPCQISRFLGFVGPILLKLSSMVGLSNERDRKLISARTSVWNLGKRFSKVTLCIRSQERNGEISWSLIGHKNTMPQNLCSIRSSENRTGQFFDEKLVQIYSFESKSFTKLVTRLDEKTFEIRHELALRPVEKSTPKRLELSESKALWENKWRWRKERMVAKTNHGSQAVFYFNFPQLVLPLFIS